jgi:hypothetical protein
MNGHEGRGVRRGLVWDGRGQWRRCLNVKKASQASNTNCTPPPHTHPHMGQAVEVDKLRIPRLHGFRRGQLRKIREKERVLALVPTWRHLIGEWRTEDGWGSVREGKRINKAEWKHSNTHTSSPTPKSFPPVLLSPSSPTVSICAA